MRAYGNLMFPIIAVGLFICVRSAEVLQVQADGQISSLAAHSVESATTVAAAAAGVGGDRIQRYVDALQDEIQQTKELITLYERKLTVLEKLRTSILESGVAPSVSSHTNSVKPGQELGSAIRKLQPAQQVDADAAAGGQPVHGDAVQPVQSYAQRHAFEQSFVQHWQVSLAIEEADSRASGLAAMLFMPLQRTQSVPVRGHAAAAGEQTSNTRTAAAIPRPEHVLLRVWHNGLLDASAGEMRNTADVVFSLTERGAAPQSAHAKRIPLAAGEIVTAAHYMHAERPALLIGTSHGQLLILQPCVRWAGSVVTGISTCDEAEHPVQDAATTPDERTPTSILSVTFHVIAHTSVRCLDAQADGEVQSPSCATVETDSSTGAGISVTALSSAYHSPLDPTPALMAGLSDGRLLLLNRNATYRERIVLSAASSVQHASVAAITRASFQVAVAHGDVVTVLSMQQQRKALKAVCVMPAASAEPTLLTSLAFDPVSPSYLWAASVRGDVALFDMRHGSVGAATQAGGGSSMCSVIKLFPQLSQEISTTAGPLQLATVPGSVLAVSPTGVAVLNTTAAMASSSGSAGLSFTRQLTSRACVSSPVYVGDEPGAAPSLVAVLGGDVASRSSARAWSTGTPSDVLVALHGCKENAAPATIVYKCLLAPPDAGPTFSEPSWLRTPFIIVIILGVVYYNTMRKRSEEEGADMSDAESFGIGRFARTVVGAAARLMGGSVVGRAFGVAAASGHRDDQGDNGQTDAAREAQLRRLAERLYIEAQARDDLSPRLRQRTVGAATAEHTLRAALDSITREEAEFEESESDRLLKILSGLKTGGAGAGQAGQPRRRPAAAGGFATDHARTDSAESADTEDLLGSYDESLAEAERLMRAKALHQHMVNGKPSGASRGIDVARKGYSYEGAAAEEPLSSDDEGQAGVTYSHAAPRSAERQAHPQLVGFADSSDDDSEADM